MQFLTLYGAKTVELHIVRGDQSVGAKTRALSLPRDWKLGDSDPNAQIVNAMREAGEKAHKRMHG